MKKPMVSVVMITYGHEKFIEEAIRGVFLQKTNFPVELIIANDHSPDNSDEIIRKTVPEQPENMTVLYTRHEKNKGMMPNFLWAINQAEGKYIAICEGDDYWTSENKLQQQIDFLEKNSDFNICFHRTDDLTAGKIERANYTCTANEEQTFTTLSLIPNNIIHTPSVVLRNNFKIPYWFLNLQIGDYPLYLLASINGKIKYFPEPMAIYRVGEGVWSSQTQEYRELNFLKSLGIICKNFPDPAIKAALETDFFNKSQKFLTKLYPDYLQLRSKEMSIQKKFKKELKSLFKK